MGQPSVRRVHDLDVWPGGGETGFGVPPRPGAVGPEAMAGDLVLEEPPDPLARVAVGRVGRRPAWRDPPDLRRPPRPWGGGSVGARAVRSARFTVAGCPAYPSWPSRSVRAATAGSSRLPPAPAPAQDFRPSAYRRGEPAGCSLIGPCGHRGLWRRQARRNATPMTIILAVSPLRRPHNCRCRYSAFEGSRSAMVGWHKRRQA